MGASESPRPAHTQNSKAVRTATTPYTGRNRRNARTLGIAKRHRPFSIPLVWQYAGLAVLGAVVPAMVVQASQPVEVTVSGDVRPIMSAKDVAAPEHENTVTLFIGDSYTHGTGAGSEDGRWSTS